MGTMGGFVKPPHSVRGGRLLEPTELQAKTGAAFPLRGPHPNPLPAPSLSAGRGSPWWRCCRRVRCAHVLLPPHSPCAQRTLQKAPSPGRVGGGWERVGVRAGRGKARVYNHLTIKRGTPCTPPVVSSSALSPARPPRLP